MLQVANQASDRLVDLLGHFGVHGRELWKSDGTAAGTTIVADIDPGVSHDNYGNYSPNSSNPGELTNVNGTLFFTADDGIHGTELWAVPAVSSTPATSLEVNGFPTTTTAGAAGSFTVTAKNVDGATNAGYRGTMHFTSSDASATLPANYTFTAADKGVHTFTGLVLRKKGNQEITLADTLNSSLIATMTKNVTYVQVSHFFG